MWYGAARDFLKLLNHKGLPVFNPLHGEGGCVDGGPQGGEEADGHDNGDPQRGMEVEEEGILNGIQ